MQLLKAWESCQGGKLATIMTCPRPPSKSMKRGFKEMRSSSVFCLLRVKSIAEVGSLNLGLQLPCTAVLCLSHERGSECRAGQAPGYLKSAVISVRRQAMAVWWSIYFACRSPSLHPQFLGRSGKDCLSETLESHYQSVWTILS